MLSSQSQPDVSIVMTTKNGLPFLSDAINSLRVQTNQNFELIVQDCKSNDGTTEMFEQIDWCHVNFVSEYDCGIGDAWQRALSRAQGNIVSSLDADNLFCSDAIQTMVDTFANDELSAAAYGACNIIDEKGKIIDEFFPNEFDFIKIMSCCLVPPWSTAFFKREFLLGNVYFDPNLKTCADFSAWLQLGKFKVKRVGKIIGSTRKSGKSMSCGVENYDQFCSDKKSALASFLKKEFDPHFEELLQNFGYAGIHAWAAGAVSAAKPGAGLESKHVLKATEYLQIFNLILDDLRVAMRSNEFFNLGNPHFGIARFLQKLGVQVTEVAANV